jgi:hypothetical protein
MKCKLRGKNKENLKYIQNSCRKLTRENVYLGDVNLSVCNAKWVLTKISAC